MPFIKLTQLQYWCFWSEYHLSLPLPKWRTLQKNAPKALEEIKNIGGMVSEVFEFLGILINRI